MGSTDENLHAHLPKRQFETLEVSVKSLKVAFILQLLKVVSILLFTF